MRGQRVLVLLSDGVDERSHNSAADVMELARRAAVTLYTVAIEEARQQAPLIDRALLDKLAEETGGRSFYVERTRQLDDVYARSSATCARSTARLYSSHAASARSGWSTSSCRRRAFGAHHRGYYRDGRERSYPAATALAAGDGDGKQRPLSSSSAACGRGRAVSGERAVGADDAVAGRRRRRRLVAVWRAPGAGSRRFRPARELRGSDRRAVGMRRTPPRRAAGAVPRGASARWKPRRSPRSTRRSSAATCAAAASTRRPVGVVRQLSS